MVIDYANLRFKHQSLQETADSMSLAANRVLVISQAAARKAGAQYLAANQPEGIGNIQHTFSFTRQNTSGVYTTKVDLSGEASLYFNKILPQGAGIISASSTSKQVHKEIEIALVLDISTSMRNGTRLASMQNAAKTFVNMILKTAINKQKMRISLVPFGGSVSFKKDSTPNDNIWGYESWLASGIDKASWTGCFRPEAPYNAYANKDTKYSSNQQAVSNFYAWTSGNFWCPKQSTGVIEFSNNPVELSTEIDAFELSDGTGTDIALAWAYRLLSPGWRGKFAGDSVYPKDYGTNVKKYIVLMTDGGITGQRDHPTYGRKWYYWHDAYDSFATGCTNAKSDGIQIFTIGFELSQSSSNRKDIRQYLSNCASNSNAYVNTTTSDIETTFKNIANQISALRVTH